MRTSLLVVLAAAAGCDASVDPCSESPTCIRLEIVSSTVKRIDHLEVDVVYGTNHSTTTTDNGGAADLPVLTVIDSTTTTPVDVGVVAAGKLSGNLLGTGAAQLTIEPDTKVNMTIELAPVADCTAGGHYCGGDKLAGDPDTVYTCNAGGVPIARGTCEGGCMVRPTDDDVCRAAGGTCIEGGFYCGGDKVDGDPSTLYRCMNGVGVFVRECANGCVIAPPMSDDDCR